MKKSRQFWTNEKYLTGMFVLAAFLLMTVWAFTQPLAAGPDEPMRYMVAQYIYKHHGALPLGDDPEIRQEVWGISYAYYPILSYMVSALFMGIASLFHAGADGLLHAARMADVLFVTGAVYFVVKASGKLFPKEGRWMFAALAGFLPQAIFLGTYVNTDSLALLSMGIMLYVWASYLEEDWTWKNCILLAVGMAICALSYYNAYGWILCSFFFFCLTILLCREGSWKERIQFLFSRGAVISVITLLLCGWWFVRNAILYDGDIFGRKACTACAEKYAMTDYKPSRYPTPQKLHWSLLDIIFYQDPGWYHNWALTVCVSFIGTFGLMEIYMPYSVSKVYILFFGIGVVSMFCIAGMFSPRKKIYIVQKKNTGKDTWKIKTTVSSRKWNKKGIMHLLFIALILIPVGLFLYYVYYSDNQAQGRYVMPVLYPLMYFVTTGWVYLLQKWIKSETVRKWFYRIVTALLMISPAACLFGLVLPFYK